VGSSKRILYLAGGRNVLGSKPGRKIDSILDCWRGLGHAARTVFGGDLLGGIGSRAANDFGHMDYHRKFYRRVGLLAPFARTVSEHRDIKHNWAMLKHLCDLGNIYRPDIVWERSCRLHCAGLIFARRIGVPYVLEWKDHLVDYRFSLFRGQAMRMEARKNHEADYIVVESGVLRDELGREGVDTGKIIVAHNAVKPDQFVRDGENRARVRKEVGVDDETVLVGYLGTYAFYHDTARLVLAAEMMRKREAAGKIKILMVGAGKEYDKTRRLAEKRGLLGAEVIMKPGVSKDEVPGILAALDIAVLPGSTDIICPIKIQEYMAGELPSVIPDYACNREVIRDWDTGALFMPKDEAALAEKILRLASDRELRERMGRRAREEVITRFNWKVTWGAALETVLEQMLGKSIKRNADQD
jgi:glycosyltransferase involved in cell wall biosynthesis